ncbi:VOC family protein [Intestinibacillus massiliensis]|uniref:VOC family protein n=1 Tax=Intestinibacillus massiliensis TaxID=1871029 RepID=UPI000B36072F|nr:VOC family protein [Intestinibacillus massiliensis]MCB6366108.1 VOC family protein [Intestinibacillus massiliensis]
MQIHHLALRVKNLEESIRFYETLVQLKVCERFVSGPGEVAYLQDPAGGARIELIAMPGSQCFEGKGLFLCFGTGELDAAHARAVSAGMDPSDIRQPEPDARYFYAYDPDGVSVQVREYR